MFSGFSFVVTFPRLPGRGLIEADWGNASWGTHGGAFPRLPGRGLIEASSASAGTRGARSPFPGYRAGASLKRPQGPRGPARRDHAFPRLPGRGLIEAGRLGVQHSFVGLGPFPGYRAGASLKRNGHGGVLSSGEPFPRLPGRGLIEARAGGKLRGARRASPFPRLPGRGLIEATRTRTTSTK